MPLIAPIPVRTALTEPTRLVVGAWFEWFFEVKRRLERAAERLGIVQVTAQGAAIAATPIPMPSLAAGLYRVSYTARITRAATVSSSLTFTLGWTDGTVACTVAGAAVTGNTTATVQSGTALVRIDQATAITYETAYASVGGTTMQYRLSVIVEAVYEEPAA